MGFLLEHNCLLVLPDSLLPKVNREGKVFNITKEGERLYPLNIPFEFCDKDHKYLGKLSLHRITIEKGATTLEGKVLKIFSDEESKIFSANFIKPG